MICRRNGASITGISPSGSSPSVSNIRACFRSRRSTGTGFPISSQCGTAVKGAQPFRLYGGATLSAAAAGASVTHVDASKGMVTWAKENAAASGLADAPIRWLVDDCVKFVNGRSGAEIPMTASSWIRLPTEGAPRARSGRSRKAFFPS